MAFEEPVAQKPVSNKPVKLESTKDFTMLDDLTHDFNNSEAFRQMMLGRHGQYVTHKSFRVTQDLTNTEWAQ